MVSDVAIALPKFAILCDGVRTLSHLGGSTPLAPPVCHSFGFAGLFPLSFFFVSSYRLAAARMPTYLGTG